MACALQEHLVFSALVSCADKNARAKKSECSHRLDCPSLADFAVRLVKSIFHLPNRKVKFLGKMFEEIQITD